MATSESNRAPEGAIHRWPGINRFQRRGMCGTDGRIRVPHTGGAGLHPNPGL